MAQKFLNNFDSVFVASVKDTPGTGTPATELDYGILRLSDGAAAFLTNPTGGDFYVLTAFKREGTTETNREIMRVTAVDNSTTGECRVTVQRGQEGTSVKAYLSGDYVSLRLTAGAVNNWVAQFDIAKNNADTATNQANIATDKANIATNQANIATDKANIATNQANIATDKANIATNQAAAAAASYDSFDDRYLGAKASDPTLDNDGNALIEGALYWNSTAKETRTWNGTAWVTTSVANAVSRGGDTMTGPLSVPAGASGAQVPRAQEVVSKTGDTMTGNLIVPSLNGGQLAGHRNKLINGSFEVNQRGLTSVADDTYCLDRWYILTETGNVTVAQLIGSTESGAAFGLRLTQPDASAKRMGFAQIIKSKNIRQYASTAMNLSARLRLSTGAAIRYAVIEHTGGADVVTSDVVNNWSSATFTPSNFFIAGINIIRTGTIAPGAATWGAVSDWGALGASVNNVIVFIWTESPVAQNVTLDCARIQYEPGVIATPHEWRMNEMALCLPYAFGLSGSASETKMVGVGTALSTTSAYIIVNPPAPMRATPSVSLVGTLALRGGSVTAGATIASGPSDCTGPLSLSVTSTGLTASDAYILRLDSDAATRLVFSAEL